MKASRFTAFVLLRSRRRFIALEEIAPPGACLPLTCFCCKNHPAITPFGYCLLPLLSITLFREPSCDTPSSSECHSKGGTMTVYRIRFKDQLDQRWSTWLGGLKVSHEANGETVLTGEVVDQAALHGLLSKMRDLHLTLISVYPVEADSPSKEEAKEESL